MTTLPTEPKFKPPSQTLIRHPGRLILARRLWLLGAALVMLVYIGGFVQMIRDLNRAEPLYQEVGAYQVMNAFIDLGVSQGVGIAYAVAITFTMIVGFVVLAVLLFRFRPNDWLALHTGMTMMILAAFYSNLSFYALHGLAPALPDLFFILSNTFVTLLVLLFPDGRLQPRWSPVLTVAFAIYVLLTRDTLLNIIQTGFQANSLAHSLFLIGTLAVLVYRYRNFFDRMEKLQTQWLLYPGAAVIMAYIILAALGETDIFEAPVATIVFQTAIMLLLLVIPVTTTVAIMRYRLYNIHLAVNRSIVYGTATVVLVGLFFVGALLLQLALGNLDPTVSVAIVALGVGIFFNPTRKRVQNIIDRRLYGFRFNLDEVARGQRVQITENAGLLTGHTIDGCKLLDVIGRGGMGEVYRAWDKHGALVAVKVLTDDLAKEVEFRTRFEREAEALTLLQHPNIVRIHASGQNDGRYYITMEFVEGRELHKIIDERGRIPLEDIRPFIMDFAGALDHAHKHGFVHRDIKPANIMLRIAPDNENYEAVLMDFGIAKIKDASTSYTGTGAVGTIEYMAPEQIMAATEVDHRADIYALGVVLFEMLTGQRPFTGAPAQVLFAHIQQPPPDPRELNPEIPRPVAKAILKSLEKTPEDRFQSATEFAQALM